jgi:Regulator of Chromosome Condensation (RCC1) repeat protein
LALTSDGTVTAWGANWTKQSDVPAALSGKTVTAIAAGSSHSLALTSDGTVTVWGAAGPEELPADLTGKVVTAIAGGDTFSLAIATGFAAEANPVISGPPVLGRPLTATPSRYTATPDSLAYQWYADGAPISGATSATYTPTPDLAGRRLTVQVTATLTGRGTSVTTSAPTQPVIGQPTIALTATKPSVRRGQALTLTWSSTFATTVTATGAWTGSQAPSGTLQVKPTALGTTTYVLTATNPAGTANAQVQVTVTRPATRLKVTAAKGEHRAGTKTKVTVRGLEAGERYTIRLGKKTVTGTARNARPLVRKIKLPKKPGRATIRVTGDQTDRTGTARIRVVRR